MYGHDFAWYGGTVEEVFLSDPRGNSTAAAAGAAPSSSSSSSSSSAVDKKKDKTTLTMTMITKGKNNDKKNEEPTPSSSSAPSSAPSKATDSSSRRKEPFYFIRYDDGDEELCSRVKIRVPSWKERQPGILADGQIVHAKRSDGQVNRLLVKLYNNTQNRLSIIRPLYTIS